MAQNQAIIAVKSGDAQIRDVSYPTLPADDYMIVRTTAVAVNPTDWKHVDAAEQIGCDGCYVGCDYAGVVELVGPGVTKPFKKGDRVCGGVNGSNRLRVEDGSFAKYIIVKGDVQIPIPKGFTDEQAATLGISISTVGQGLYQTLGLPLPNKPTTDKTPILIYGGSTATGIYGIQFAKLSGMTVITTASPKNHALLRDLGADHVVDYSSPTATDDIRALTSGKLALAWDCHATKNSAAFCARAMGDGPGHYAALLFDVEDAVKAVNDKIKVETSLYYTIFGEPVWYGQKIEAKPADYEFGKMFWDLSKGLLDEGKVRPIETSVNRGGSGLAGVIAGMEESRAGKVSAEKLVYTI